MAQIDKNYHNLLEKILQEGYTYEDPNRKGVNRIEIPSYTFRHEFKDGFPAITTKKLNYKSVVTELIWFLRGDTNIKYLVDNGCNIWNKDAYNYYLKWLKSKHLSKEDFEMFSLNFKEFITTVREGFKDKDYTYGDLGHVYGAQWRKWDTKQSVVVGHNGSHNEFGTIIKDQITELIKGLKERPLATDHIINAWNVGELDNMALQPCHYGFQIVVRPLEYEYEEMSEECEKHFDKEYHKYSDGDSSAEDYWNQGWYKYAYKTYPKYGFELHWQQRSVDTFLGLPFNIASYATLALILEKITGYKALGIQGDLKKVHLYDNSLDAVKEQLSRDVNKYDKCELDIDDILSFELIKKDINYLDEGLLVIGAMDFELQNYESYPALKVEMLERNK